MRTGDFDYELPAKNIAQHPAATRDQARLLVLQRDTKDLEHRRFPDLLRFLEPGDVLVLNDSRVIPARLRGVNARTGGQFELLLVEEATPGEWWVMLRPGRRGRVGTQIVLKEITGSLTGIHAQVIATNQEGHRLLRFSGTPDISKELERLGEMPLPPYIERPAGHATDEDRMRYQTVFARDNGSMAAPTAGLHFTPELLGEIEARGVRICYLTLHVGLGTFAPVKHETIADHAMHAERYRLRDDVVSTIAEGKRNGGRVVAVGTTTLRVLESVAAHHQGRLVAEEGKTAIFIHPPYDFKIVDGLVTNFHLPRSTLLMLVSAFAAPRQMTGREIILSAYAQAVRQGYRFYSYGDAMLLL
jgi:S-adenosylmethionine:tRNA ribosyltransferase-isomerase